VTQITSLKLASYKTSALPQELAHATRSEAKQTPVEAVSPPNARVRGATRLQDRHILKRGGSRWHGRCVSARHDGPT